MAGEAALEQAELHRLLNDGEFRRRIWRGDRELADAWHARRDRVRRILAKLEEAK